MEPRDLPVTDAERAHIGEVLTRAVGRGLLSLGEFTERMDSALAATTRAELNAAVIDVPTVVNTSAPQPVAVAVAAPAGVLRARMSSITRTGRWDVPDSLRVEVMCGSVTLDLRSAIVHSAVLRLDARVTFGSLTVVVPVTAHVETEQVDAVAASVTNKVRGSANPTMTVIITGQVRAGSVTIKHPFGSGLRSLLS